MYSIQTLCSLLVVASYASARGYGMGGFGGMGGSGEMGGSGGMGGYGGQGHFPPRPYGFGYQAPDQMGNNHFRKEQGDGSGSVQGSYGYTDNQGLYRQVDYVANAGGFRASVKTNEPGTDDKENPADVNMMVQSPPAGIQKMYSGASGGFGGYGGSSGFGGMMTFGGGSGAFGGIPRSMSGKSGY